MTYSMAVQKDALAKGKWRALAVSFNKLGPVMHAYNRVNFLPLVVLAITTAIEIKNYKL